MISIYRNNHSRKCLHFVFWRDGSQKTKRKRKRLRNLKPVLLLDLLRIRIEIPLSIILYPRKVGNIGKFVPYSSVPEDNWLHGFSP